MESTIRAHAARSEILTALVRCKVWVEKYRELRGENGDRVLELLEEARKLLIINVDDRRRRNGR